MVKVPPMRVNVVWDKLSRLVILLVLLAGLVVVFFWYLPLIQQNQHYRRQILNLDGQIEAEEKMARDLKASIDGVQNDRSRLEHLAREKLGFAKSNETIIRFEAPAVSEKPVQPSSASNRPVAPGSPER